jgi:tRNA A-37 threonylcarbamoyl transferase component Bud32
MQDQPMHPAREELAAFSAGHVEEAALTRIQQHIAQCETCRGVLKSLPPDRLTALLRDARLASDTAHCPANGALDLPPGLEDHPRYRIIGLIGAGGMGRVYRAEHRLMKRAVALKVISPRLQTRPDALARFRREVEAVAKLAHAHIASAYDADEAGGRLLLVEEFVEGTDLAEVVRRRVPVPVAEACAWVCQAASGLQHAHERGLVHRDIKPQNLMLTPEGTVKILDFGVAHLLGAAEETPKQAEGSHDTAILRPFLTEFGEGVGTAGFVAPEQHRDGHTADARADVYSLGCTLYYLLAGQSPASGISPLSAALANRRRHVPPALHGVLDRMTSPEPDRRYQSMKEVEEALAPFCFRILSGRTGKRRWARALVLLLLLLTVVLVAFVVQPRSQPTTGCVRFSRPTDTILVSGHTQVTTAATYEARVFFTQAPVEHTTIFNEFSGRVADQWLGIRPGELQGALFPVGSLSVKARPPLRRWHHVALVYDGEEMHLYLDGERLGSKSGCCDIGIGVTDAFVGASWRPPGENPRPSFIGYLDTLRVSDVARYTGQTFSAPQGKLPNDAHTLLLYNFQDPADSLTVRDESGHQRTGTFGAGFSGATCPQLTAPPVPEEREVRQ